MIEEKFVKIKFMSLILQISVGEEVKTETGAGGRSFFGQGQIAPDNAALLVL